MAALPPFLGFVAKEADFETVLHSAIARLRRRRSCWRASRSGSVFTTIYSLRFLFGAFGRKGRPEPSTRVAEMHRPEIDFPRPARAPGRGRPAVRGLADAARHRAGRLRRHRARRRRTTTSRCGTASVCRCCCRCSCWRPAPRPSSAAPGCAGCAPAGAARQRRPHLRRRPPRRRRVLGAADRGHPARLDPGDAVGDPVHARAGTHRRAGAGRARPTRLRAVGLAAAGRRRAADAGRRARRDHDAQPAGGRAAGRRDRLRLRHDLRLPRRTGSGADAVPGRDADAGDLRAGAADAARRDRPRAHQAVSAAARRAGARRRRHRHHAGRVRDGRPHRHADRRTAARRSVFPRARRQHRQRAARRHPRLGHHGRDLGAARRRDRRGVNGVPAPGVSAPRPGSPTRASPTSAGCAAMRTAPPSATSPGCAAANCATRGTGRWSWRSRPG